MSSKEGFSVVAPTRMTVPSSTTGRNPSLLGAVEAVDLVDEEDGSLPAGAAPACLVEHPLEVGDAGKDRRQGLEMMRRRVGQQARDRRLSAARRPPENHRGEPGLAHHAPDRPVRTEQVILAQHVLEPRRTQPIGERPRRFRLEQPGLAVAVGGHGSGSEDKGNRLPVAQQRNPPAIHPGREKPFESGNRARFAAVNPKHDVAPSETPGVARCRPCVFP